MPSVCSSSLSSRVASSGSPSASSSRDAAASPKASSCGSPVPRAPRPAGLPPRAPAPACRVSASKRSCAERASIASARRLLRPLVSPAAPPRQTPARAGRRRRAGHGSSGGDPALDLGMLRRSQNSTPARQAASAAGGPSYSQSARARLPWRMAASRPCPARPTARARAACRRCPALAEVGARAAEAERARRLGQSKLVRELERPLGGRDRLAVAAADEAGVCQLGVRGHELRPGRLRLEQRERLGDRLLLARVAEDPEHGRECGPNAVPAASRSCRSGRRAERLLERRFGLLRPAML